MYIQFHYKANQFITDRWADLFPKYIHCQQQLDEGHNMENVKRFTDLMSVEMSVEILRQTPFVAPGCWWLAGYMAAWHEWGKVLEPDFRGGRWYLTSPTVKPLVKVAPNPKTEMFLVSSCSCLRSIHWSHVLSWEWRCSWSSADRRCSNYIWVINNFIAY